MLKQILLIAFLGMAFTGFSQSEKKKSKKEITWYSWEEGIELAEKKNKKVLVDIYTDWCGFCKRMDRDTFTDPKVIKYMNKNFVMIKLDGDSKEDYTYKGETYSFKKGSRRGYNGLAVELVKRNPAYPTFVFLDESQEVIDNVIGYKLPVKFYPVINYFGSNAYEESSLKDYVGLFKNPFSEEKSE